LSLAAGFSSGGATASGCASCRASCFQEGCVGDIARYRAIQDNDLAMGHVAQSVYNQIKKEIGEAEAQCSEGHEAQARATILASRKRHGYPSDL